MLPLCNTFSAILIIIQVKVINNESWMSLIQEGSIQMVDKAIKHASLSLSMAEDRLYFLILMMRGEIGNLRESQRPNKARDFISTQQLH